ncbi:hypothetical protein Q8A67_015971 [Cirrhinus molitorella]|uniref:Secreted protein n=1 Tax=Cirrhinus molitorella TaxID=172907 RepID=A0AA88PMT3_9TELE|nr:hypothetical protein Q8A67_015971 [Cirrhinus molitorella]
MSLLNPLLLGVFGVNQAAPARAGYRGTRSDAVLFFSAQKTLSSRLHNPDEKTAGDVFGVHEKKTKPYWFGMKRRRKNITLV